MYRVFEALDELGAIVEEARGVPMTAGCVVPRGDVLELLDDIKDAIPGDLDDAFRMTGYFLDRDIWAARGIAPPESRTGFIRAARKALAEAA